MSVFTKLPYVSIQEYEKYLPNAFDDSLSLTQKVNLVIKQLNDVITQTNIISDYVEENITGLRNDFEILKDWLENDGLRDRATEILTLWFNNGKLADIINNEVFGRKADVKKELLDTAAVNNSFLELQSFPAYPILQGGTVSDDGKYFFCYLVGATKPNEKGIILKYQINDFADFTKWSYVGCSLELNLSHGNDMIYYNGEIYIPNTNDAPNQIHVIDPVLLTLTRTFTLEYGATALTYSKKLNQFITRRKASAIFDYYDLNFKYIKSIEPDVTFDTTQGIDSDDSYIYEPLSESDLGFGNSIAVFDHNGTFIKRMGMNTVDEIEFMTNYDNQNIGGFYTPTHNYLGLMTVDTKRRLTAGRYVYNSGRNTSVYKGNAVFNGAITLKLPITYYTHLSITMSADGVELEPYFLDITDGKRDHIVNRFRMTGTGQLNFYRSQVTISSDYKTVTIVPFAQHIINPDGTRVVNLYSSTPSAFTVTTSIGISEISAQILSGQRLDR